MTADERTTVSDTPLPPCPHCRSPVELYDGSREFPYAEIECGAPYSTCKVQPVVTGDPARIVPAWRAYCGGAPAAGLAAAAGEFLAASDAYREVGARFMVNGAPGDEFARALDQTSAAMDALRAALAAHDAPAGDATPADAGGGAKP